MAGFHCTIIGCTKHTQCNHIAKNILNNTIMEKSEIIERLNNLKQQYGEWSYDIPLPYNIWTKGNIQMPHTRLKRIVQLVNDTVGKPLSECRVLDLGCLDGQFSIEFAQQGATTLGIEV